VDQGGDARKKSLSGRVYVYTLGMARPALPAEKKKRVVSLRLPPPLVARLAKEAGGDGVEVDTRLAGRQVARLVDQWARTLGPEGKDLRALASVDLDSPNPLIGVEENAPGVAPHRHRRGKLVAKTYEAGVEQRHYACSEPGCTITLT
jgi:hypothetical protein